MNKIPVLLCGIGGFAKFYLNEFLDSQDESFELVGVADPFAASSPRFTELEKRGIPVFKSPDEFYSSGAKASLAVIGSPIHTHHPYTVICFNHGSNVLCEKPVTGDLARLDDLIAREENSSLFAAVGFQMSFSLNVQLLKEDIIKGIFGKPLECKAICLTPRGDSYYGRNNWAGKLKIEGETILDSPLNNGCAHELHNLLFLLGDTMNSCAKVNFLEAETWQGRPDIENYDAVSLNAQVAGTVKLAYYTAHCVDKHVEYVGEMKFEKAVVSWTRGYGGSYIAKFNDGQEKIYNEESKETQKIYDSLEAVRTGVRPICTVKTVRGHLDCVSRVQEFPIKKVPQEKLISGKLNIGPNKDDPYYYVPGLREAFLQAYMENTLPSQVGFTV